jgi:hypothetical protein
VSSATLPLFLPGRFPSGYTRFCHCLALAESAFDIPLLLCSYHLSLAESLLQCVFHPSRDDAPAKPRVA